MISSCKWNFPDTWVWNGDKKSMNIQESILMNIHFSSKLYLDVAAAIGTFISRSNSVTELIEILCKNYNQLSWNNFVPLMMAGEEESYSKAWRRETL